VQREKFQKVLEKPDGPERTAAIAAWVQARFQTPPVLVGGSAVELYTKGAYTSGDFDFVGGVPSAVAQQLEAEGFHREGRHWVHEEGEVFLEFPSSSLDQYEKTAVLRLGGHSVLTVRPEVLIVDLLASWQFWKSGVDGVNAFLVWKARRRGLDQRYLGKLAKARGTQKSLRSLRDFARSFSRRAPTQEEVEKWAGQKR
jgi:hypothetical protein